MAQQRLDDDRDALPAADAGGAEPVAAAPASQRVQQVERDAGAARAERVAQRDRAAVHVGALAVEPQLLLHRQVLGRERLVDLDQVHLVEREPRPLQRAAGRRGRDRCP